jgi:hypothetical protein
MAPLPAGFLAAGTFLTAAFEVSVVLPEFVLL